MVGQDDALEALQKENDALRLENNVLRRRVAELEQHVEGRPTPGQPDEPRDVYRALFDVLVIPLVLFRRDGSVADINLVNQRRFGITREMAVGHYNIFRDPEAAEKGYAAAFERALAGESTTMPPTVYDTGNSPFEGIERRRLYAQITFVPFTAASGELYLLQMIQDITAQVHAQQAAREREELFQALLDSSTISFLAKDSEGRYILASHGTTEWIGRTWEDIKGKTDFDIFPRPVAERLWAIDRRVLETLQPIQYETELPTASGGIARVFVGKFPLVNSEGKPSRVCAVVSNVTEHRRAEAENRRLQEEIIRVQEAALRALSTPIIPIAEGVLVMPLIGDVNRERASQVVEVLLRGVAQSRARIAILDLTGVTTAGPEVADGLIRAARAVGLLGAQVVLTGMQPRMAQSLASMGEALAGIVTRGTLESGIDYAMGARRMRRPGT